MAVIENAKLGIVGAGAVGTSLAYAALIRGSAREVVVHDIDEARVDAEVLDLAHGTLFAGSSRVSGGADLDAIAGSHIIAVTAGAKQRPGQTRLDLAQANAAILRALIPQLVERAPDAILLIVTNPCDVMTLAAQRLSGLPPERVIGSGTVLDTSRLRWLLAERAGVASSSVHAMIVGEHGDSEFPLWSQARIGPVPIREWRMPDGSRPTDAELDAVAADVRTSAYRIIAGKGATNYAIGLAGARIVEAVLRDERAILPVSSVLRGYHGIDGVALSVPAVVGSAGVVSVPDLTFSTDEDRLLHASADVVAGAAESVGLHR